MRPAKSSVRSPTPRPDRPGLRDTDGLIQTKESPMPSSNVCWGVEVGAGAIKALKLELVGEGNARVVDFVMLPHKKVLSTPDLDQNDALRVALGALASQVDLTNTSIAVSVPGHSAFARFAKLPPVEPKKV